MEKQKMTIHRALSELKLIDSKIEKQTQDLLIIGGYQGDRLINGHKTKEDFEKTAQSNFNSVNDLIKRKGIIKSAVVKANAETKVKINDVEMTIADAINFKNNIEFKKTLVQNMKNQLNQVVGIINKNNELVESNLQKILEAMFGKENVKSGKEDVENARKPYLEANTWKIYDPLKIEDKIKQMEEEIDGFESEVDSVLSEINAITMIEI